MRRRLVVRGRVQGVGFRWFVREHARRLGLAGRVRNLPDGSVDVEAGGDAEALDQLERYLGKGPSGATVQSVDVIDLDDPDSSLPHPFAIER